MYGGDCGELITSAHILGLPHAPGYPTFVLLGKLLEIIVPFGNVSLRINLFSALLAAGVLALLYQFLKRLFWDEGISWGGIAGVLMMGSASFFIEQSLAAEVFLLNLLFLIGILLCGTTASHQTDPGVSNRWLFLGCFLFGLGLGNHHTLLVACPFLLWALGKTVQPIPAFLYAALFFFLGISVYLLLPIRAQVNPAVNFGDPETWSRFWSVITRKEFGSLALHPAAVPFRNMPLVLAQLHQFWERCLSQVGWTGLILAAGGLVAGFLKKDKHTTVVVAVLGFLGVGFGFELYSNLSPGSDIGQWRLERFYLLPLFALSILVAVLGSTLQDLFTPQRPIEERMGLDRRQSIIEGAGKGKWITGGIAVLAAALFLFEKVGFAGPWPNYRDNFVFRDFATSLLRSAPPNTQLIIDRVLFDEPTSSLLVATQVESKRPDIQFFYRPGTLFNSVYGEDLLDLPWEKRLERQLEVERNLKRSSSPIRFLAFEKSNTFFRDPVQSGLLIKERSDGPAMFRPEAVLLAPNFPEKPRWPDYPRRLIGVHTPYFLGKSALEKGRVSEAKNWFLSALEMGRRMAWLMSNLGGLYAQADQAGSELLEEARNFYVKAIEWDPYFSAGYFGLGYVATRAKNFETAAVAFEHATRMDPTQADAFYMWGVVLVLAGREEAAREPWEKYLELAPHGSQANTVRSVLDRSGD